MYKSIKKFFRVLSPDQSTKIICIHFWGMNHLRMSTKLFECNYALCGTVIITVNEFYSDN